MAVKVDISEADHLFIGEDRTLDFHITEAGVPLDCSGFDLLWALSRNKNDTPSILKTTPTITVGDGDGTGDRVSVPLDAADTANLLPGWYSHALWRTDSGSAIVLSYGRCYLGRAPL